MPWYSWKIGAKQESITHSNEYLQLVLGIDHLTCKRGYGFLFRSEFFFRTTQELEYLLFLSRKERFFFTEFNIRLWQKLWIKLFFFSPPKSEYFFQQHWESEYFFRKNISPLQVKWSFPYVTIKGKISHKTVEGLGKITIIIFNYHTLQPSLWVAANNIMGRMSLSSSSTQYERMEFTQCFKIAENKRWFFYNSKTDRVICIRKCIVK